MTGTELTPVEEVVNRSVIRRLPTGRRDGKLKCQSLLPEQARRSGDATFIAFGVLVAVGLGLHFLAGDWGRGLGATLILVGAPGKGPGTGDHGEMILSLPVLPFSVS